MRFGVEACEHWIEIVDVATGEMIVRLDYENAEIMAEFMLNECRRKKRERLN